MSDKVFGTTFCLLNFKSEFGYLEIFAQIFVFAALRLKIDNMSSYNLYQRGSMKSLFETVKQNQALWERVMKSMRNLICDLQLNTDAELQVSTLSSRDKKNQMLEKKAIGSNKRRQHLNIKSLIQLLSSYNQLSKFQFTPQQPENQEQAEANPNYVLPFN